MQITLIGLNHHTAPLDIRERLAFPASRLAEALSTLGARIGPVVIVSTCNRTEIYTISKNPPEIYRQVRAFLGQFHNLEEDRFSRYLYIYFADEAVQHICRVAAGLDSQILGEPQILGQLKDALNNAREAGTIDKHLDALFRQAIRAGKRARTETGIARNAVSHSSVAVTLARTIFGNLKGRQIIVVGTGKMGTLAARTLNEYGAEKVVYINRTYEKAVQLATIEGAKALPLQALPEAISGADIVISSIGATKPLITADLVERIMRPRRHRPILFVDLAVPRNIDPETAKISGVYLYNVDDLDALIALNQKERAQEIGAVEKIIAEEVIKHKEWTVSLEVVPTIVALRQHAENIRQSEMARIASTLESLSAEQRNALEAATQAMINKMLHEPTVRLKQYAVNPAGLSYNALLRDLFNLGESD